jgi:dTMP kinase
MSRGRRGRFIVVEGLDGAGTTTQAERLADWLRARGRRVELTAEPSRGPIGALIRQVLSGRIGGGAEGSFDPAALALLFAADRRDHLATEVEPCLAKGCDVVSDRFTLSSLAYQAVALSGRGARRAVGDPMGWVAQLNQMARPPDLTIFLEVPAAVALRRRRAASAARELFEVPAFQRQVASAYAEALRRVRAAGERVALVDGGRPVEIVAAAVTRAASAVF